MSELINTGKAVFPRFEAKQSVYSMGYGIIYPKTGRLTPILQPLVSKGHIASVVPMKLFEQFDNSGTDAPKQALAVLHIWLLERIVWWRCTG